jgi:hypothetical protein
MPNAKWILLQDKMELTRQLESGPNIDCVLNFIYENLITTLMRRLNLTAGAVNGGLLSYFFFIKKPFILECTLNLASKSTAKSWYYESPYCPFSTDTNLMCIYMQVKYPHNMYKYT